MTLIRTPPEVIDSAYINSLPLSLRHWIMDLEASMNPNCDRNVVHALRAQVDGLVALLRRVQRDAKSLASSIGSDLKV